MAELNNKKFGFTPVYSSELIQEIKEAVKDDEKLIQTYKKLKKDLLYCYNTEKYDTFRRKHRVEEKGKVENATVEELVFTPIDGSPHGVSKDKNFDNKYYYKKKWDTDGINPKDFPNFKYL